MSLNGTHENEVFDSEGNAVGYHTHFGGLYVCYTCGHLCECGEDSTEGICWGCDYYEFLTDWTLDSGETVGVCRDCHPNNK